MNDSQARAFISYSHVDSGNLDQLKLHLRPIERKYKFLIWDDKKLLAGDKWRSEIDRNLSLADVIVVLLSKEFL